MTLKKTLLVSSFFSPFCLWLCNTLFMVLCRLNIQEIISRIYIHITGRKIISFKNVLSAKNYCYKFKISLHYNDSTSKHQEVALAKNLTSWIISTCLRLIMDEMLNPKLKYPPSRHWDHKHRECRLHPFYKIYLLAVMIKYITSPVHTPRLLAVMTKCQIKKSS